MYEDEWWMWAEKKEIRSNLKRSLKNEKERKLRLLHNFFFSLKGCCSGVERGVKVSSTRGWWKNKLEEEGTPNDDTWTRFLSRKNGLGIFFTLNFQSSSAVAGPLTPLPRNHHLFDAISQGFGFSFLFNSSFEIWRRWRKESRKTTTTSKHTQKLKLSVLFLLNIFRFRKPRT